MVAVLIHVSSDRLISYSSAVGWLIRNGLLKRKFAKVELAPGPPLSQMATGASSSMAGYIQKKSMWLESAFEGSTPA